MLSRISLLAVLLFARPVFAQDEAPHPIVPGYERFGSNDGVEAGRLLLGELNCVTCHKPDAAVAEHLSAKKAPLLADAGSRYTYEWIRAFIADPQKLKPGATMPQPSLPPAEFDALAHYLASLKRPKPLEAAGGSAPAKAKEIFNRVGCAACHSPLDGPARPGAVPLPDLKAKYATPVALAAFLLDPLTVRPSGRMPKLNLTPAEAMAIATHYVGLPPRDPENPAATAAGLEFEIYDGSFTKVPDFDTLKPVLLGFTGKIHPGVTKKEDGYAIRFRGYFDAPKDGVYTFATHSDDGSILRIGSLVVVNNDGIHGGTEVSGSVALKAGRHAFSVGYIQGGGGAELKVSVEGPGLSKREIPAAALSRPPSGEPPIVREAAAAAAFTPDPALVEKGRELFTTKRCATCHEGVPGQKPLEFKPLAQIKSAGGCLTGKPANFSLTAGQVEALSAAIRDLASLPKPTPAQRIQRTMTALNCYACHERDRRGGPTVATDASFVTTGDDMGDEGRIAPHLNGVGAKLRPQWLQTVLASGTKVRPYMATRMPVFGAANLGPLAEDFEKTDASSASASERDPDLVKAGRLLTGTKGMSCVTCHMFQNHKSLGIPGMDLVHMAQRLRRDWFTKYLLDPPSLRPGTRMPTYWPEGKSVRKDILDGDTAKQIEALWQYLSEGGKAQIPIGIGPQPIPLVPVDEALMYRNFIQGAGARAIAVGYPEKVHLAFDSLQMRPALFWRGDFIDASKHWVDRGAGFQSPAGEDVVSLTDGAPFAVLADPAAPWPKASGHAAGWQFGGYELDKRRRPTFEYSLEKVQVRDFFESVEGKTPGFKRTLTVQSKDAPAGLWYRAAAGKKIEEKNGEFLIDNGLRLRIDEARIRGAELLVPVELKDGSKTIVVTYSW